MIKQTMTKRSNRISLVLLGAGLLTAVCAFVASTLTERAELLLETPYLPEVGERVSSTRMVVRGQFWYIVALDSGGRGRPQQDMPGGVYRVPVHGGPQETLYRGPLSKYVFTDKEILLLEVPPTPAEEQEENLKNSPAIYRGKEGSPVVIDNWPYRRAAGNTSSREERHSVHRFFLRGHADPTLVRITFSDGPPAIRRNPISVEGYDLNTIPDRLTEQGLYWIRPDATEMVQVIPKDRNRPPHLEMEPADTLFFRPHDGVQKVVRQNVLLKMADPVSLPDSVVFEETGVYPRSLKARYRTSSKDPARLERVADGLPMDEQKVIFGDRYYYLQWPDLGGRRNSEILPSDPPVQLWSARRDGKECRLVTELRDRAGRTLKIERLFCDTTRLGVVFSRYVEERRNALAQKTYGFMLIDPGRVGEKTGVEHTLCRKETVYFGEEPVHKGYLYFHAVETRRDPLDFLRDRSTEQAVIQSYRFRL